MSDMKLVTLLLALALALLLATPAQADTLRQTTHLTANGAPVGEPYQRWITEAKVATPPVTVELSEELVGGLRPAAIRNVDGTYAVHFSLEDRYAMSRRWVFFHELGHIRQFLYGLPVTEFDADRYARCATKGKSPVCRKYL